VIIVSKDISKPLARLRIQLIYFRKLHHALKTAQMKTDNRNEEVIYPYLFATCYKHGELHNLLKLTITDTEEVCLCNFVISYVYFSIIVRLLHIAKK